MNYEDEYKAKLVTLRLLGMLPNFLKLYAELKPSAERVDILAHQIAGLQKYHAWSEQRKKL